MWRSAACGASRKSTSGATRTPRPHQHHATTPPLAPYAARRRASALPPHPRRAASAPLRLHARAARRPQHPAPAPPSPHGCRPAPLSLPLLRAAPRGAARAESSEVTTSFLWMAHKFSESASARCAPRSCGCVQSHNEDSGQRRRRNGATRRCARAAPAPAPPPSNAHRSLVPHPRRRASKPA